MAITDTDTSPYDLGRLLISLVHSRGTPVSADGTHKAFVSAEFLKGHSHNFVLSTREVFDPYGVEITIVPAPVAAANREREELVEKFAKYIRKNVMVSDDYSQRIAKALVDLAEKEN